MGDDASTPEFSPPRDEVQRLEEVPAGGEALSSVSVLKSRRRSRFAAIYFRWSRFPVRFAKSFFGPVFDVDLRSCSRQKRTYFLRTVYLGILTFVVAVAWQGALETSQFNPAQGRMNLGMLAPTLLVVCGWFQLIALTLLGPALTSGAVLLERTRRTLPVLLATPLTAWNIVASKLLSRSIQLLLLAALSLPVMASVQAFGGIETLDVLGTMCLGIVNGLFAASVGLAVSVHARSAQRATLASYGVLAGVYLLVPAFLGWAGMFVYFIVSVLLSPMFSLPSLGVVLIAAVNPFVSMAFMHAEVLSPGWLGIGWVWGGKFWLWAPNALLLLGGTWVMLVIAAGRLRRLAEAEPTSSHPSAIGTSQIDLKAAAAEARMKLGPDAASSPNLFRHSQAEVPKSDLSKRHDSPHEESGETEKNIARSPSRRQVSIATVPALSNRPRLKSRPVGDDPILWRELNRRRSEQSGWTWVALGVAAYLLLLVYLPAGFSGQWSAGGFHGTMAAIYLGVLLVVTAAVAAPSIAVEKEASCWPLLLGTPLSGRQILTSKGRVVLHRVYPYSLFLVGHLLFFTLLGFLRPLVLLQGLLIAVAAFSFILVLAMGLSLTVKGSTRATAATFLVGLVLWLFLPGLARGFDAVTRTGEQAYKFAMLINPLALMGLSGAGAAGESSFRVTGFTGSEFTLLVVAVSWVYLLAAGGLLAFYVRRFNRIVGRTS